MTDFLIVGRGLAATVLMHSFKKSGISFKVIGRRDLSNSSRIAAGIWNPIVFKRHSKSWLADELIPYLISFYRDCEKETGQPLIELKPIIKPFTENQEKTLWLKKSVELGDYTQPEIIETIPEDLKQFTIPNGYGIVNQSGQLNVKLFLDSSWETFKAHTINEAFIYNRLKMDSGRIVYKSLLFKNIIFCEGHLVKNNPWFYWIPLKPAKGEIINIKSDELKPGNYIFNKNGFIIQNKEAHFKVGATYAWDDLDQTPTKKALQELEAKLKNMTAEPYELVTHEAGIRPSSVDRRPIIGRHPKLSRFFVFNGLGTKGVMHAPYFAKNFVNFFLQQEPLNAQADIKRFYNLYDKKQQN